MLRLHSIRCPIDSTSPHYSDDYPEPPVGTSQLDTTLDSAVWLGVGEDSHVQTEVGHVETSRLPGVAAGHIE